MARKLSWKQRPEGATSDGWSLHAASGAACRCVVRALLPSAAAQNKENKDQVALVRVLMRENGAEAA